MFHKHLVGEIFKLKTSGKRSGLINNNLSNTWTRSICDNILTSKNPKPSSGIEFSKSLTQKWKFWNVSKAQHEADIDLEVVWGQSIRFWKAYMSYFSKISLIYLSDSLKLLKWFESSKLDKILIFKDFWSYIVTHYRLSYLNESLNKWNFWKVWHLSFPKPYRLFSYEF